MARAGKAMWSSRAQPAAHPAPCSAVLLALLAWFGAELITGGGQAGLAERISAPRRRCGRWRWSCPAAVQPGRAPGSAVCQA
jgi:hypothetical protein